MKNFPRCLKCRKLIKKNKKIFCDYVCERRFWKEQRKKVYSRFIDIAKKENIEIKDY